MKDYLHERETIRFVFPLDGDCVNEGDGFYRDGKLYIWVKVFAPYYGADICVNGVRAVFNGEYHVARVPIQRGRFRLTAIDDSNGESDTVYAFNLPNAQKKFRLSVDDNIRFLQDITENQDAYASIFDNPYLRVYKRAHDETGVCVNLHLFYFSEDGSFSLDMVTDKFKAEWEANADWLRLSFHSLREMPASPYTGEAYAEIPADCEKVHREILRFAGEKSLAKTTTLHFGATDIRGVRALKACGYDALGAFFEPDGNGGSSVSYSYPLPLVEHLRTRDFWVDGEEGVTFFKIDRVLNFAPTAKENLRFVEEIVNSPTQGGFVELMIHEQYFYEDYPLYIAEFEEIILQACRYLKARGYEGSFIREACAWEETP